MLPQANQIYRHFKGNLYKVVTIAVHTETEEELVIYQALYGNFKIYARPLSMFMSEVDREKYPNVTQKMRFELIEQMVAVPVSGEAMKKEVQPETTEAVKKEVQPETTEAVKKEVQPEMTKAVKEKVQTESVEVVRDEVTRAEAVEREAVQDEKAIVEDVDAGETEITTSIDPLLEAYLDADSYRERLNILHGLQHRITEHMLNTMAIVIDFELPEGDIRAKYDALNDCLLTKEKYECNRIF